MVELNEYCLWHIFEYLTPVEWIKISEVCQFWKLAVSKLWKNVTEISYTDIWEDDSDGPSIPISAETANKIVLNAAEFCCTLNVDIFDRNTDDFFMECNQFCYKIDGFKLEETMKLWAENSTELTEIKFYDSPKTELLKLFFKNNQIKTLSIINGNCFWTEIPTDSIENLRVRFANPGDDFVSFRGHFPNLKKLDFGLSYTEQSRFFSRDKLFSMIFPHILGIKSLTLNTSLPNQSTEILSYIADFVDLEELILVLENYTLRQFHYPAFDEKLHLCCPKLRVVLLAHFYISENALQSILSLPNLESLDLSRSIVTQFSSKQELPELKKLSKIDIIFDDESAVDVTVLCKAVKYMTKLQRMRIYGVSSQHLLQLTCEAINVASTQGRDIVVEADSMASCKNTRLRIENKNNEEVHPILYLDAEPNEETYFDDVITFVRNNCKAYRTVIF